MLKINYIIFTNIQTYVYKLHKRNFPIWSQQQLTLLSFCRTIFSFVIIIIKMK